MNAIETDNLTKVFGAKTAVDHLNLRVPKGSIFGFLGPNGAGKTTTIRLLMGLALPTSGTASVLNEPLLGKKYLKKVGFLPDVPNYYNWMRAEEFLIFCGELFGAEQRELRPWVKELLEITGLKGVKTKIGGYSRGMKQRLGIAQALINHPELVIMDEPTSALDPIGRKEVLETIERLGEMTTILFSTHILGDVERICDMVAILDRGRLVREGTIDELRAEYAQKAIAITVYGETVGLTALIRQMPWAGPVNQDEERITVQTKDLAAAQQALPGLIAANGNSLKEFRTLEPTLEDIFVRLVNHS